MIYAPIIIPTCNRLSHLKKCIDSLAANKWAKETELYISQDYPPEERFFEGYEELYNFLDGEISGFKRVYIFHQKENLGCYKNVEYLMKKVSEKYDRYFFTEDDNEFSANVIEYMNIALEKFAQDDTIIRVCTTSGVLCPESAIYQGTYFILKRPSPYGCGGWIKKDRWIYENLNEKLYSNIIYSQKLQRKIWKHNGSALTWVAHDLLGEIPAMRNLDGTVANMDYNQILLCLIYDRYAVYPKEPLVRNNGYDGSGINCPKREKRTNVETIDQSRDFQFIEAEDKNKYEQLNNKAYAGLKGTSMKDAIRSFIIIGARRILDDSGFSVFRHLIKRKSVRGMFSLILGKE